MASWFETLDMIAGGDTKVVLLSTATTGLHKSDQLIAVNYVVYDDDKQVETGTLFKLVPEDLLNPSKEFHKITKEVLMANGATDEDFKDKIQEVLCPGRVVFTYNVPFQQKALTVMGGGTVDLLCPVCDIIVWMKAAESKMMFYVNPPMDAADAQLARNFPPVPWKRFLTLKKIIPDTPPGLLPVTYNVMCLSQLYQQLCQMEPRIELAD